MQPDETPLSALVQSAQAGDSHAFGLIYDRLYDRVYGYTYRRVYDNAAAEDITANTFYRIMTRLESFKWNDDARFYAWVFRIAMNELVSYHRKGKKYTLVEEWLDIPAPEATSIHDDLEHDETVMKLKEAVGTLPQKLREVVELYYFADLSHGEIAVTLGIREGAARVRLHRAVEALQASLKKEYAL